MPTFTLPDGDELSYRTIGDGEPLLLVLGTTMSMGHWPQPVVDALSAEYRVILYDHRGMGQSSASTRAVSMQSLADDAAALLDHLGSHGTHVLGWSLGSAVAQELALVRPDLVSSLVLYATWGRADGLVRALLAALRTPWDHGEVAAGITAGGIGNSPEALDDPEFTQAMQAAIPLFPHTDDQIAMAVRQFDANAAHDSLDRLHGIVATTTVIVGEQDLLTPPRLGRAVAERIPGARLEVMEGPRSSHSMVLERPQEWLQLVLDHLRRSQAIRHNDA